jgi:hypothetical protein
MVAITIQSELLIDTFVCLSSKLDRWFISNGDVENMNFSRTLWPKELNSLMIVYACRTDVLT